MNRLSARLIASAATGLLCLLLLASCGQQQDAQTAVDAASQSAQSVQSAAGQDQSGTAQPADDPSVTAAAAEAAAENASAPADNPAEADEADLPEAAENEAGNEDPASTASPAPEAEDAAEAAQEQEQIAAEDAPAAAMTTEERMAAASEFIDRPVAELIEKIGEPDDRDYAKSCFGEGEDGNLYYDGFIVFTYRENGEETVRDVDVE